MKIDLKEFIALHKQAGILTNALRSTIATPLQKVETLLHCVTYHDITSITSKFDHCSNGIIPPNLLTIHWYSRVFASNL